MNLSSVNVLIIEKSRQYKDSIQTLLSKIGDKSFFIESISDFSGISTHRKSNTIHAILLDLTFLKDSINIETAKEHAGTLPVLALTDTDNEASAIEAIRAGAQDYLVKNCFDGKEFIHTVRTAIERQSVMVGLEKRTREFQAREARLLNVIVNNVDGIIIVDEDNNVCFVNPATERLFSRSASEFLNKPFDYAIDISKNVEITVGGKESEQKVIEMRTVHTLWENRNAYLISLRDITERKLLEQKLKENEERYSLAIKGSKDGLWDWDLKTDVIYYSTEWKLICGFTDDEIGVSSDEWLKRVHPDDISNVKSEIDTHLAGNISTIESEHRLLHKDNNYRWVVVRGTAVFDKKGKPTRIAGSLRDITDRKEAEEGLKSALAELKFALASEKVLLDELDKKNKDLVELSITDGLTGLYNHRFIQERVEFEFKRAKRYRVPLSCLMIDIDHFKRINDNYGHQFGDLVLRELATVLKQNSREVDICGRYGGEEFLIITTQNSEGAMTYASKLHKAIESHVFRNDQHSIHITVSIGITEYAYELTSKQEMIERCDRALYQAKRDGRNLIRIWKEEDKDEAGILDVDGISDLKTRVSSLSDRMRTIYMESTNALLKAVDVKDHYTLEHSENVSRYAIEIARAMHFDEEEIAVVKNAALLHDIGKIGIDKAILTKDGPLTRGEFEVLKKHPMIGVTILKDVKFLEKELPIIKHHHERYDGSGYPQRLKGREIPFGALILGVADAYDAMRTDREFKTKLSKEEAVRELKEGQGTQFSPEVVDVFLGILEKSNFNNQ